MASAACVIVETILRHRATARLSGLARSAAAASWLCLAVVLAIGFWPAPPVCGADRTCPPGLSEPSIPSGDAVALAAWFVAPAGDESVGTADDARRALDSLPDEARLSRRVVPSRASLPRGARHDLFPDKTGPPHA